MTLADALHGLLRRPPPCLAPPRRGGHVVAADGALITVAGLDAAVGDAVRVGTGQGELIGFAASGALVMPLGDVGPVRPGAVATPFGRDAGVMVGDGLLGRVIDGLGRPLDGRGAIADGAHRPLGAPPLPPGDRLRVTRPLATGIRAIDGLLTLGIGQRVGIMAGTGVGKSVLLGQITRWAATDVVVMALIGERGREITDFMDTELAGPARARTVTLAVPASEPSLLRVRAARRAFAIAEAFRDAGRHCLLILDSLSRVVHGAREVALARGEPDGSRGYPASALALVAELAERAGGNRRTGGAITLIATVLAEGDDRADPVLDAARGVMDGHILLSRRLAGRGQFPAIDIVASASRVMGDVCAADHLAAATRLRRQIALSEENRDLVLMGAYAPGSDAELDAALAAAPRIEAFLSQPRHLQSPWAASLGQLAEAAR